MLPAPRHDKTPTGRTSLVFGPECDSAEFSVRAQEIVDHFNMCVEKKIAGLDELIWITRIGDAQFCISWDIWFPEVAVMAWEQTLDAAVEKLVAIT